ncbi:hypothetical protein Taro_021902 [Colocasia esculenta]|uniref:Uncharacterized protein n=1 Tax=Colocasia esculenta TaxID=4460 RepID=A0A843VCW3_COLES|nr:hypothetical protein [Colocasia esculenta]
MDRFKLKLDIYKDYDVKEAVTRIGPKREALSSQIDVDELFDEEHPLNAWVETRQEMDVPEFDPRDCSWAEGELDGVEARDPELRVSEDQPLTLGPLFSQPRHSAILPETSRVPLTQPALRRAATQKERSSKAIELEKRTYTRQKKRKVQQPIRSDDTTQDPNDDDDDDDGAATGATGAGQGYAGYTGATGVGLTESYNIREAKEKDKGMDKGDMKDNNIMQSMSGHLGSQTIVQGLLIYLHFSLPFYRTQILVAHLMEYKEDGDLGLHKNKSLVALVKQQVHTNRLAYGVQLHHNLEKAQVNNLHQEGFKWMSIYTDSYLNQVSLFKG